MAINSKSTKTEILEAYMSMKEKLDALESMKDDPMKTLAKGEAARVANSAKSIIEKDILNPEIVQSYIDLQKEIENKKETLKQLFAIEAEANSMVAIINANKEKEVELKNRYNEKSAELEAEFSSKKEKLNEEIILLEERRKEALKNIETDNQTYMEKVMIDREREEEEYIYNLKRNRKKENDAWEDQKVAREKILTDREVAVLARETAMDEKEEYVASLERKVSEISTLVDLAREEGMKKGKADAEKSHAFETRTINTKNEYEQNALKDKVARLEAGLEKEREAKEIIQDKLDSAYAQMRELASETVKSTGGVKILDRDSQK